LLKRYMAYAMVFPKRQVKDARPCTRGYRGMENPPIYHKHKGWKIPLYITSTRDVKSPKKRKEEKMIIVQKFGGSSLATLEHIKKVAEFIKNTKQQNKIVVVVSAMGKTTNHLLNEVRNLTNRPNLREVDQLLSTGEIISACLLSIYLNELGVKSISLTGRQAGIITNANFSKAFIEKINTKRILKELNTNQVVVITGFQGVTKNGDTTTLGRGGSDTSTIALACALNGSCEIYSDIDCLYACDPRFCLNPKPLHYLDYNATMEMAFNGTKALETRSVEIAKKYNKKIYTGKSLRMDKTKGTIISKRKKNFESVKIINLSTKTQILHIKLTFINKNNDKNEIFKIFSKHSFPLEMFNKCLIDNKCFYQFCLDEICFNQIREKLLFLGTLHYEYKSKISLIGNGLASHSEIANQVIDVLHLNNINVYDISVSEMVLSLLVNEIDLQKAVDLLVKEFGLGKNEEKK